MMRMFKEWQRPSSLHARFQRGLAIALILAAQAVLAQAQALERVGRHEWIEIRVASLEIGHSLQSSIVLPNGQKAVLPAAEGKRWLAVHTTLRSTSEDSARKLIVLENVYVLDGEGASHPSSSKDLSYYPALRETTKVFTFQVPALVVPSHLRFGTVDISLRGLVPTPVAVVGR